MWREIKRPPVSAQQAAFLRRLKLRRYTIYTIQILLLVGFSSCGKWLPAKAG